MSDGDDYIKHIKSVLATTFPPISCRFSGIAVTKPDGNHPHMVKWSNETKPGAVPSHWWINTEFAHPVMLLRWRISGLRSTAAGTGFKFNKGKKRHV